MMKFTGESNCKMTHWEFNGSQREFACTKGRHGIIVNMILAWAEQLSDIINIYMFCFWKSWKRPRQRYWSTIGLFAFR